MLAVMEMKEEYYAVRDLAWTVEQNIGNAAIIIVGGDTWIITVPTGLVTGLRQVRAKIVECIHVPTGLVHLYVLKLAEQSVKSIAIAGADTVSRIVLVSRSTL